MIVVSNNHDALGSTGCGFSRVYQFRDRDRICGHDISVTQCHALDVLILRGGIGSPTRPASARLRPRQSLEVAAARWLLPGSSTTGQRVIRSNVSSRDVPPSTGLKTKRPPTNEYRVARDIAARKRSSTSIAGDGHAILVPASGPTRIAPGDFSYEARRYAYRYRGETLDSRTSSGVVLSFLHALENE
jgi:hypothetical protein